jgi:hypothetical protein
MVSAGVVPVRLEVLRGRIVHTKGCAQGEVLRTRFHVDRTSSGDEWWYLESATGCWRKIPDDIVLWGEHALDTLPTLYIWDGVLTCFVPPKGGN